MDDFERRLANSMKAAAEQMPSPVPRARSHRAGLIALAASVVVATVIAGTTWLLNPGDSPGPAEPAPDGAVSLEGEWLVTALTNAEGQSAMNDSYAKPVRLSFEDGKLEGSTGCNALFGTYEQGGDGGRDVDFANVGTTKVACLYEPPVRDRLQDVRHVSGSTASLSLLDEDQNLVATLERVSAEPINIEGEWKVAALTGPDGGSLLLEGHTPTLRFLPTNSMTGIEGCSGIAADYNQSGATDLVFSNIRRITDDRAKNAFCADPPLADRLADVRHVSEANGKLQLHAEDWMIIAVLERETVEPAIELPVAQIATYEPTGASAEALAYGTLIISNGCLVLGNETEAQLIVFDATTTTLSFDGRTLHTTDERGNKVSVQVGDRLSFAGGNGPVPEDRSRVTIPTACENAAKKEAFYTHGIGRAFPID